jgi:hypothetical protein
MATAANAGAKKTTTAAATAPDALCGPVAGQPSILS